MLAIVELLGVRFGWPYEWMASSFVAAGLALVLPWLTRPHRRSIAIVSAIAAVSVFVGYIMVLYDDVPASTVLFPIDLYLLVPLLIVAVLSCGAALIRQPVA
jgi:hypothetical protein